MSKQLISLILVISFIAGGLGGVVTQSFRANASTASYTAGSSGPAGLSSVPIGTIDTGTPSADGAQGGSTVVMQSASASNPGLVNTSTQTLAGQKTLGSRLVLSDGSAGTPSTGFASRADTGMFYAGGNGLGFAVASTSRWVIDNNGAWGPQAGNSYDVGLSGNGVRNIYIDGLVKFKTAGGGLQIAEGSNATMGAAVCNGTTEVTIATTKVTASSRIFLTEEAPGGTPLGVTYVSSRSAGTSFGVKCAATDTSTFNWLLIEPL